MQAVSNALFNVTFNANSNATRTHMHFVKAAIVWDAYAAKHISLAQRDMLLNALRAAL